MTPSAVLACPLRTCEFPPAWFTTAVGRQVAPILIDPSKEHDRD